MEELLQEKDEINGPLRPPSLSYLGESWSTIHQNMQKTLLNQPPNHLKTKPSIPPAHARLKTKDNKQNHRSNAGIEQETPNITQVFKRQLAILMTPKDMKKSEGILKLMEERASLKKGKQVEKEIGRQKKNTKHINRAEETRQENNKKLTLLQSKLPQAQLLQMQQHREQSSKYRIKKSKTEHQGNNVFKESSPQLNHHSTDQFNFNIKRSKSSPQFMSPFQPFHSKKQSSHLHCNIFHQKPHLSIHGACNYLTPMMPIRFQLVNNNSKNSKGIEIQDKRNRSKQEVNVKRSNEKRSKMMSDYIEVCKKQESRWNIKKDKKDWLRVDTIGLI